MQLPVRRWFTLIDQRERSGSEDAEAALRKVAAVAVIENPYAGRRVQDLSPMIAASAELGVFLAKQAVGALAPYKAESYGKGSIAGLAGEQEHANALITTTFAEPLRKILGGAQAWISSCTKVAPPGTSIDIPLAHKDALYVRSHYDAMTIALADAPMPDEVVVIVCLANRGRIGARVGGLRADEISANDGLR